MPNFFAHYLHGEKVLEALPKEVLKNITSKKFFFLGLQGPDIFYPYKALSLSHTYKVNTIGSKIHKKPFIKFMEKLFDKNELPLSNDLFSYMAGFICHFSLDSVCHPFVDSAAKKNSFSHGEIEVEFDRILLELQGYDPIKIKISDLIFVPNVKSKALKEVANAFKAYKKITPKILARAIKDFKFFKKIFYAPLPMKQHVLQFLCRALLMNKVYNSCVMRTKVNPKSFVTNSGLIFLFNDCIEDACELITNFYERCQDPNIELSKKFKRTFV